MSTRERWIDECNRLLQLGYQLRDGAIDKSSVSQEDLKRINELEAEERLWEGSESNPKNRPIKLEESEG